MSIGIRGSINELILSLLTDRKMIVSIGNSVSDEEKVELGVPQGSILGPLLFLLFINDLPLHVKDDELFMNAGNISFIITSKK